MESGILFGPVNSRRLGRSLGINLFPAKICSENCVYCECGPTVQLVQERREWIPTNQILQALDDWKQHQPTPLDAITFAGSGEPLLHSGFGHIVTALRERWPRQQLVLLTNGTPLVDRSIWEELRELDLIIPSIDALSPDAFKRINRPANDIDPARIAEAISEFSHWSSADIQIEILLVQGINDNAQEIGQIVEALRRIRHSCVHLGTVDRPGTCPSAHPVDMARLKTLAQLFDSPVVLPQRAARAETPAESQPCCDRDDLAVRVLQLIRLRPSTTHDVSRGFNLDHRESRALLEELEHSGKIRPQGAFWMRTDEEATT